MSEPKDSAPRTRPGLFLRIEADGSITPTPVAMDGADAQLVERLFDFLRPALDRFKTGQVGRPGGAS